MEATLEQEVKGINVNAMRGKGLDAIDMEAAREGSAIKNVRSITPKKKQRYCIR